MRNIVFLISLFSIWSAQAQFFYGSGKAVNLENDIGFNKNTQLIKSGVTLDPKTTSVSAGAGSLIMKTDGSLYVKMDAGSTTNWRKFLDDTFDVITSLGYTPEDVANKSTNTSLGTSDTLYPSQNAVKSYVDTGLSPKLDRANLKAVSPIVVSSDASTATVSFDYTSAIHNNLSGLNGDPDYYHLSQAKYNAVQNLTASGTQTNFTGDVQSASCVYYGSSTVDGSYRECSVGGALIRSKRVSGSWSEVYRVE